jgi:acetyl-CoA decarbonylase/synthase, CODH/ACS complex subunit delta
MQDAIAVSWEFYTSIAAAAAGAEIICVRHPKTIGMLRQAFASMKARSGPAGVR